MSGLGAGGRSILEAALGVLLTAEAPEKARAARRMAADWRAGGLSVAPLPASLTVPDRPARPAKPELLEPRRMPRRRIGAGPEGRAALLHALAHIELNAVDLMVDLIARFGEGRPVAFFDDWARVADEEGKHFLLLAERLEALGSAYGALPAHDGLWEAALATAGDILPRLAIVPLVLEARGLDVTPGMIERLEAVGDVESAAVLRIIYEEEIGHVAVGKRWFDAETEARGLPSRETWQQLVREGFAGRLKRPFNVPAREAADFPETYYGPLVEMLDGEKAG